MSSRSAARQLDGIFIGTTQTAAMRNSGIAAVIIYLGAHYLITPHLGAHGIWTAFLIYYAARWMTMIIAYPKVRRQTEQYLT